jgi:general secretion pathway protein D
LILTPHVIRDQTDLRRIFERKMQERQEFLDRYFVFSDQDWSPPRDWTRTNGLVEDIRKSYQEIADDELMLAESQASEDVERGTSEPLELPGTPRTGAGDEGGGRRGRTPRTPPAPGQPPAGVAPPTAIPAPAPAPPPPPPVPVPQGRNDAPEESPVRITPLARSVNVDRVE